MSNRTAEALAPLTDEAERAVLGAVLLSGSVALPAAMEEGIRADDFYYESHRLIFSVMEAMRRDGESIDCLTLKGRLVREGILKRVGGAARIDDLASIVPNVGNLRQYAQMVVRSAMWRERRRLLIEAQEAIRDQDETRYRRALGALRASELHYRPNVERADTLTP